MPQHIHDDKVMWSIKRLERMPQTDKIMTEGVDRVQPQDVVVTKNDTQYGLSKLNLG